MRYSIIISGLLFLMSCSRPMSVTQVSYAERRMSDSLSAADPHVESVIRPYRDSMDAEMKMVLVVSDTILTKSMPESDLGNILAGILLDKSKKYSHRQVDIAVINFGGIRITQLSKGDVTVEKAFELMPFDNKIVLLEIDGNTLQGFFDKMASTGGTPIAGARYIIDNKKATKITIGEKPINPTTKYIVAISDYLANGGDNLDILKSIPQISTGVLLRDAFIEGFRDINAKGQHLKSIKDGRVTVANN